MSDDRWHSATVQYDAGHVQVSIDSDRRPDIDYVIPSPSYTYSGLASRPAPEA